MPAEMHNPIVGRAKVITATRDMTAASGDVAYTGVGFKPRCIVALAAINTTEIHSIGFAAVLVNGILYAEAPDVYYADDQVIRLGTAPGATEQRAVIKSFDSDGFTLTWTKAGAPAANTGTIRVLCIE